jgi:hypothetical protein
MAASHAVPDSGDRVDRGSNQDGGVSDENTHQSQSSPLLPDRTFRVRAVPNPAFRVGKFVELDSRDGKIGGVGEVGIPATGKPAGISTGKPALIKQNQAITRTEWFRYELDFRKTQRGFNVTIRKRLKWSNTRYSKQIVKRFCPQLTRKMIDQISVGKFSKETIAALQNGGIQDGFIRELQSRIGKGNGKRRTDLTEYERSLLSRIESGISASNRGRNA